MIDMSEIIKNEAKPTQKNSECPTEAKLTNFSTTISTREDERSDLHERLPATKDNHKMFCGTYNRMNPNTLKKWTLDATIEKIVGNENPTIPKLRISLLVEFFSQGYDVAFIARYKEKDHGGMSPEAIRQLRRSYDSACALNARVSNAIDSICPKVVGFEVKQSLELRLKKCVDFDEFSKITNDYASKREMSNAERARDLKYESAVKDILEGSYIDITSLPRDGMKSIKDVEEHLKALLALKINESDEVKEVVKKISTLQTGCPMEILCELTESAIGWLKEDGQCAWRAYKYSHHAHIHDAYTIQDHTLSAMNRGVENGVLKWSVVVDCGSARRRHPFITSFRKIADGLMSFYESAKNFSIQTFYYGELERATKKFLDDRSRERAVLVFERNVEQLFEIEGIHAKYTLEGKAVPYIISLDPGSIVKTAFLSPRGKVLGMSEFWFHSNEEFDAKGRRLLKHWAKKTQGKNLIFAIGDGSRSEETQKAVSNMISRYEFPESIEVHFCVVSETGASQYSISDTAREEFGPHAPIKQVSAISIGRRLLDPMSELIKISPLHLSKGQYQHSMDEKRLLDRLHKAIRDRVSFNGVDLNLVSKKLLTAICGLDEEIAGAIVEYREKNGSFKSRNDLKRVPGMTSLIYQQCIGFLTVSRADGNCSSWSPFDETSLLPEDYKLADRILYDYGITIEDIRQGKEIPFPTEEAARIFKLIGERPKLRPHPPLLKKKTALSRLRKGDRKTGVVNSQTDLGLFVKIGREEGLLHISYFQDDNATPKNFIGNREVPKDYPKVGDFLNVVVEDIQEVCGEVRISLKPDLKSPVPPNPFL